MFVYFWVTCVIEPLTFSLSVQLKPFFFLLAKAISSIWSLCICLNFLCFFFSPALSKNAVVCWTLDMQNISSGVFILLPITLYQYHVFLGFKYTAVSMANTGRIAHDHLLFAYLRVQLCVIHCEHIPASLSDQKSVFLSVFSSRRIWRDTWALQASPTKCTESLWSGALSSPWWLWVRKHILWMYWFWSAL